MTRAIAVRMLHAGAVASSTEELAAWIARTDDLRDRLTKAGFGTAFDAGDLFPLFENYVAKLTAAKQAPAAPQGARSLRIGAIVAAIVIAAAAAWLLWF